jgi:segregation and condensation protein B
MKPADDRFEAMDPERLRALLEAAVFASPEPVGLRQLARATGWAPDLLRELLDSLAAEYARDGRGLRFQALAGGYRITTRPELHDDLRELQAGLRPPLPLSRQAVETAAVIALLQPVTAAEVQAARKVRNADAIRTLLRRKIIAPAGRAPSRGRPLRYRTTQRFLVEFGLNDLSELPSVEAFQQVPGFQPGEP